MNNNNNNNNNNNTQKTKNNHNNLVNAELAQPNETVNTSAKNLSNEDKNNTFKPNEQDVIARKQMFEMNELIKTMRKKP